ncbi:hypothetical protein [Streptomyces albiaxialis]|uniref:TolB family protein n=1 Tax=Streptomyces albiaxialis TaxID=329523 RepID=UPI0031E22D3B
MRSVLRTAVGAVLASGLTAGVLASTAVAGEREGEGQTKAAKGVERISTAPDGKEGDGSSGRASLSADGRYAAFTSRAANLVAGDTNGVADVFVRDLKTGKTQRVSLGAGGAQADGASDDAAISADGRHVAFSSEAGNLDGDATGSHVYVRDLRTGTTERIKDDVGSPGFDRSGSPALSADGRTVAFQVWKSEVQPGGDDGRIYALDRDSGKLTRVSQAPSGENDVHAGMRPSVSANGAKVAYQWAETQRTGRPDWSDLYVFDLRDGKRVQADVTRTGATADAHAEGPRISADGRSVTYHSPATNVVPGDTNGTQNVFVRDLAKGATKMISAENKDWAVYGGTLSRDNSKLLFTAGAPGGDSESHAYLRDLRTGATKLVSAATDGKPTKYSATAGDVDRTGATVTFTSASDDLVPGDTYDTTHAYARHAD